MPTLLAASEVRSVAVADRRCCNIGFNPRAIRRIATRNCPGRCWHFDRGPAARRGEGPSRSQGFQHGSAETHVTEICPRSLERLTVCGDAAICLDAHKVAT